MNKRLIVLMTVFVFLIPLLPAGSVNNAAAENEKGEKSIISFKPPKRGTPTRRIGGGYRGGGRLAEIALATLTPEDTGYTVSAQPDLYWYVSVKWEGQAQIAISDVESFETILEKDLKMTGAGIQKFSLAKHNVTLEPDKEYEWMVALIPAPDQRSGDIIASGMIKRIQASPDLKARLKKSTDKNCFVYAEEGLWYDALSSISAMIDRHPGDRSLREQRATLLDQVNLSNIAEADRKAGK